MYAEESFTKHVNTSNLFAHSWFVNPIITSKPKYMLSGNRIEPVLRKSIVTQKNNWMNWVLSLRRIIG